MPVLVDSNVLIDLWDPRSRFHAWADVTVSTISQTDLLAINPIIWTELAAQTERVEDLDSRLLVSGIRRFDLPWECLASAARAFGRHCEIRRQARLSVARTPLPDFFIGAHAEWAGLAVMTRDVTRFRTYFPTVRVIAPEPSV